MIRVQFNGDNVMYAADFQVASGTVQLTGKEIPRNTAGFKVYRLNGEFLGDYSDYTEIVREIENGLQFSLRHSNRKDIK